MANVIIVSLSLLFVSAFLGIGGGYLVWLWRRENKGKLLGVFGAIVLFIYGVTLTLQPAHFGRVYAALGGIWIVSAIIWGRMIDKKKPDRYEIIGAGIALIGAAIIMYTPR